ncbi:hypothetical protein [Macrococcus bovicus]|nr:hypothetical protein [Macrococcus bovicus]
MTEEKNTNVEEIKEERTNKRFEQDEAAKRQEEETPEAEKKNFI